MLTIDQILAAKDRKVEEVQVPEWGGSVFIRRLSAQESLEFYLQIRDTTGTEVEKGAARTVAALSSFLCDEEGSPIASIEQARQILGKSAGAVHRIVTKGHEINATEDKQVVAGAKNSEPSRADSSPSV